MTRHLAIILFAIVAALPTGHLLLAIRQLPKFERVRAAFVSKSHRAIVDRHGQILDEASVSRGHRRLSWVSYADVPPELMEALNDGEPVSAKLAALLHPPQDRERKSLALALEMAWKSNEIWEAYLNFALYRGELQGLAAASVGLFDRRPAELSRAEVAVIAALLKSQALSLTSVREQACAILQRLDAEIECQLLTPGHLAYLDQSYRIQPFLRLAPQIVPYLQKVKTRDNLWHSTLDRQLQWRVLQTLMRENLSPAAAVVLENSTGHVLAYVSDGDGDEVKRKRAAGSVLAPLIYAEALHEQVLTTETLLSNGWRQKVPMGTAMRKGLPLAVTQALELIGVENFVRLMGRLGFSDLNAPESYGPSLGWGDVQISALELANSYRTLANDGVWSPVRFSPQAISEEAARPVLGREASFIVKMLMSTGRPVWTALKTSGDEWSVGFSEKYTVAVTGPSSVWLAIMQELHQREPSHAPLVVDGVVFSEGNWFIRNSEDGVSGESSRIVFPHRDSLLTWDESIEKDRMFIQIAAPRSDQNLYLNGQRLGRAQARMPWEPRLGANVLELRSSRGKTVDRVRFEVRGRRFAGLDERAPSLGSLAPAVLGR